MEAAFSLSFPVGEGGGQVTAPIRSMKFQRCRVELFFRPGCWATVSADLAHF